MGFLKQGVHELSKPDDAVDGLVCLPMPRSSALFSKEPSCNLHQKGTWHSEGAQSHSQLSGRKLFHILCQNLPPSGSFPPPVLPPHLELYWPHLASFSWDSLLESFNGGLCCITQICFSSLRPLCGPHTQPATSWAQHPGEAAAGLAQWDGLSPCVLSSLPWTCESVIHPMDYGECHLRVGPWRYPTKSRKHELKLDLLQAFLETSWSTLQIISLCLSFLI